MDYTKATDEQLLTIIKSDMDCSHSLMSGAVHEALSRGIFNKLIYHIFDSMFKDWRKVVSAWNIENKDILSIGYCGVLLSVKRWKPGKASFNTFVFMNIKSEFTRMLDRENTKGRQIYKVTESYDKQTADGINLKDIMKSSNNVEREVLRKIELETALNKLTEAEKEVITYFLEGYSLNDMAVNVYHKSVSVVYRKYKNALIKMGIGYFKFREKESA
jgi:RNA polymerase sigma factor (sigma-70 family)